MNKINFFVQNIDIYEICGTKKRITAYSRDNIELSKYLIKTTHVNKDTEILFNANIKIDDICDFYNINKYYYPGKYDNVKVAECCIIPAIIISLKTSRKGYIFCDNEYGKISYTIQLQDDIPVINLLLYDDPKEAGKIYLTNKLDNILCQYNEAISFINKSKEDSNKDEAIALQAIHDKYKELENKEIEQYKQDQEQKRLKYIEQKDNALLYYKNNIALARFLDIDLTNYNLLNYE